MRIVNVIKGKTGGSKEPNKFKLYLGVLSDTVKVSGKCQERLICKCVQYAVCGPGKKQRYKTFFCRVGLLNVS